MSSDHEVSTNIMAPTARTSMDDTNIIEKEGEVNDNETNVDPQEKRKRALTSSVWSDMKQVMVNGEKKGKCNHCGAELKMPRGATSQLLRHLETCVTRLASLSGKHGTGPKQSLLCFDGLNEGVNLGAYKYDKEKVKDALAKMIIVHEYPFRIVEHEFFILFCKLLNPRYDIGKRQSIRDYCIKVYEVEKKKLMESFKSLGRVSLTSDLWTSSTTKGYMCLTGHYLDQEWKLQKRILNFCMLPPPHTGVAIADKIFECLSSWKIQDKVSTMTFDNASSNDAAIRVMKDELAIKGKLFFGGKIFHVRCCAHILNLMVQDGLNVIKDSIMHVRESVKHVTLTPSRLHKFNEIVKQLHLPSNKSLILDVSTRWNSTYHMLSRALIFKDVFLRYQARDPTYAWLPSEDDWEQASEVCKFLEIFDDATKLFSGVQYPTSNLFFPEVWKIRKILDDNCLDHRTYMALMCSKMKGKFDKYWGDCSLLMAIGAALDPRNKLKYIEYVLKNLYPPPPHPVVSLPPSVEEKKIEYLEKLDGIRDALYELYADYCMSRERGLRSGNNGSSGERQPNTFKGKSKGRSDFEMWAMEMNVAQPNKNELDVYLEEGIFMAGDDHFDCLGWWKANTLKFPYLSKMARDILSIPITTVASESAFSAGRRVLDEFRSSLNDESIEALLCAGDWLRMDFGIKPSSNLQDSECSNLIHDED